MLVGWVPLAVLAAVQGLALHDDIAKSFLLDFAAHARFLIAAPLFILAEAMCLPRLGIIARHFLDSGLVAAPDRARFNAAADSTVRLLNSKLIEIMVVALAYAVVAALIFYFPFDELPGWNVAGDGESRALSLPGYWHALISFPLLLVLFFGWMWRLFLWGRFLWLMSRLDLQLVPAHPDLAGGLRFVGTSVRGYVPLGCALGAVVAGAVANRVVHQGVSPLAFKYLVVGLVVFVLILFVGPLGVFVVNLRWLRRRGTFEYGALASGVGRQFERKWLNRVEGIGEGTLDVPDFSTTTDLYQIVSNVHEMKDFPFDLSHLYGLIIAVLLPFVPVALAVVPFRVILENVVKLLL